MGRDYSNIIKYEKTCIKFEQELIYNTNFIRGLFLVWRGEYKVYILILIGVAMLSSFLTLILHCCLIVGKESDKNWEEEQIMKKEETEE